MTHSRTRQLILAAAVAALATVSQSAWAQYPANQDGHANDANNRVGSSGYNTPQPAGGVTGNQIIYGNVTGGKEFRGPTGARDSRVFTGPTAGGVVYDFVKNSAGTPGSNAAPTDLTVTHPFYSDTRLVAPPLGSIPEGFNGGYVGTNVNSPFSSAAGYNFSNAYAGGLQSRTLSRDTLELNSLATSSNYAGLAPLNSNPLSVNLSTPLWGVRQPGMTEQTALGNTINGGPGVQDRSLIQDASVLQMQRELQDAAGLRSAPAPGSQNQTGNNAQGIGANPRAQSGGLGQPLSSSLNSAGASTVGATPLVGAIGSSGPLNATLNTQESFQNRLTQVPPAAQQSAQLAQLQKRMQQTMADHPLSDAEANRFLLDQQRLLAQAKNTGQPNVAVGAQGGGTGAGAGTERVETTPLVLHSLADGVKATGLHDLLTAAEEMMRQDKFESAIEQYNQASRVAPNNVLIPLGRAIAELGAGYYAQSDRDLRQVFRAGPELLWGQVDLKALLSADRLTYLRKDLASLAASDTTQQRPWFLQAFIAYNTGDSAEAQRDLAEAETRGGKMDWTIRLLKERWGAGGGSQNPAQPTGAKPPGADAGK